MYIMPNPAKETSYAALVEQLEAISTYLNSFSCLFHDQDKFWSRFTLPANVAVITLIEEYKAWVRLTELGIECDLNSGQNAEMLRMEKIRTAPQPPSSR